VSKSVFYHSQHVARALGGPSLAACNHPLMCSLCKTCSSLYAAPGQKSTNSKILATHRMWVLLAVRGLPFAFGVASATITVPSTATVPPTPSDGLWHIT
jgi:hypothetical protein